MKLQSYLHLRPATSLPKKALLERVCCVNLNGMTALISALQAKLDRSIDFLDVIAGDVPSGTWSLQQDRGGSVVYIRNLLWPGFVFYHVPGTRKFGHVYFGLVNKNLDLPFML